MTKFKGRISCKQYMKSKTAKWVFKWSCRRYSKGYLYEFDLYLGKKEKAELGFGKTVVLDLYKKLENTHCMLYFDNFNSPVLVEKLFNQRIYCFGAVQSNRKSDQI